MSDCIYYDILQAVGTEVRTIAGAGTVSVRNRPLQLDGIDTPPNVIIWPGEGAEAIDSLQWGIPGGPGRVVWLYPVLVVLITAGNRVVEEELLAYLTLRQSIRDVIYRPLLGGAVTVFDCDIVPQDVFDKLAFQKGNYDVTGWQLYFKSSEAFNVRAL